MPIREGRCLNPHCPIAGDPQEHYYHNQAQPMISCDRCGGPTELMASNFSIVWTGPIGTRYRDKDKEGYHGPDGQVAWTRNTPDGKPKPVHLENWQDVARHCKSEGIADPRSIPRNVEVSADGKSVSSGRGMPGTEI